MHVGVSHYVQMYSEGQMLYLELFDLCSLWVDNETWCVCLC